MQCPDGRADDGGDGVVVLGVVLLRQGINLLVPDLFPLCRDPQGIHKAIWDEIEEASFVPDASASVQK